MPHNTAQPGDHLGWDWQSNRRIQATKWKVLLELSTELHSASRDCLPWIVQDVFHMATAIASNELEKVVGSTTASIPQMVPRVLLERRWTRYKICRQSRPGFDPMLGNRRKQPGSVWPTTELPDRDGSSIEHARLFHSFDSSRVESNLQDVLFYSKDVSNCCSTRWTRSNLKTTSFEQVMFDAWLWLDFTRLDSHSATGTFMKSSFLEKEFATPTRLIVLQNPWSVLLPDRTRWASCW